MKQEPKLPFAKASNRKERARQVDRFSWVVSFLVHCLLILGFTLFGGRLGLLAAGTRVPRQLNVGIFGLPEKTIDSIETVDTTPAEDTAEEDARKKAEAEARAQAELEAQHQAEDEARVQAQLEAQRQAEELAKLNAEELAQRKAEEAAQIRAEEEAKKKAEAEAKRKAEEAAKLKAEEEARKKAEEAARKKAEEEAKRKAEEEARRRAEEIANMPGGVNNPYLFGGGGFIPVGLEELPKDLSNELGYTYSGTTKKIVIKVQVVQSAAGLVVQGEPQVLTSSGIPALDNWAKNKARTDAFGKPGWHKISYEFAF